MKLIIILLLTTLSILTNAQKPTIEETKSWIKEILEGYAANEENSEITYSCEISFFQNIIIIHTRSYGAYGWDFRGSTIIPLNKISSVRIVPFNGVYNLVIRTTGQSDITLFNNYSKKNEMVGKSQSIALSKKIDENDLKNRLIKAFKFLVNESGGQIKDDPF